jgi:hypothetical protein
MLAPLAHTGLVQVYASLARMHSILDKEFKKSARRAPRPADNDQQEFIHCRGRAPAERPTAGAGVQGCGGAAPRVCFSAMQSKPHAYFC